MQTAAVISGSQVSTIHPDFVLGRSPNPVLMQTRLLLALFSLLHFKAARGSDKVSRSVHPLVDDDLGQKWVRRGMLKQALKAARYEIHKPSIYLDFRLWTAALTSCTVRRHTVRHIRAKGIQTTLRQALAQKQALRSSACFEVWV